MNDTIIVALISLIGSLGGTFGGIVVSSKLLTYRVDQVEKKVESLGDLIGRMFEVESRLNVMDETIKNLSDKIAS